MAQQINFEDVKEEIFAEKKDINLSSATLAKWMGKSLLVSALIIKYIYIKRFTGKLTITSIRKRT